MKVRMKGNKRCRHYSAPHLPNCPQSFSATAGAASESPSPGGFRLLGFLVFSPEQPKVTAPPPSWKSASHPRIPPMPTPIPPRAYKCASACVSLSQGWGLHRVTMSMSMLAKGGVHITHPCDDAFLLTWHQTRQGLWSGVFF